MQNQLRDDEPPPLEHPFEFVEDLFEDYGNTSNFPIQTQPLPGTTQSVLRVESVVVDKLMFSIVVRVCFTYGFEFYSCLIVTLLNRV